MFKCVVLAALIASLVVPLAAQAPAGWKVRLDRSKSAQDPDDKSGVTFMAMGNAFHVAGGPLRISAPQMSFTSRSMRPCSARILSANAPTSVLSR